MKMKLEELLKLTHYSEKKLEYEDADMLNDLAYDFGLDLDIDPTTITSEVLDRFTIREYSDKPEFISIEMILLDNKPLVTSVYFEDCYVQAETYYKTHDFIRLMMELYIKKLEEEKDNSIELSCVNLYHTKIEDNKLIVYDDTTKVDFSEIDHLTI